jgi:CelD/BcsL family acetyltransferase involved in cellulose biosynthesis
MSLRIEKIQPAEESEWRRVWKECDYATYFHSPGWAHIWREYTGGAVRPTPRRIVFSDGLTALAPLSEQSICRGILKRHVSSPAGTFGGCISSDPLAAEHFDLLGRYMKSLANLNWRINPYAPFHTDATACAFSDDYTYAIDLETSWDVLCTTMNRSQIPRKVRQAEKHHLRVDRMAQRHLKAYHAIYLDCQHRWDSATNSYTPRIFELLYGDANCEFWGVFGPDNRMLCAGPFLIASRHVASWLALASSDSLHMKPYECLYYHLIQHYKERGFKWFDFNPSGGHEGVDRFKKGFGAAPRPSPVYIKNSIGLRVLKSLSGGRVGQLLRRPFTSH